jgi:hypothetical protein
VHGRAEGQPLLVLVAAVLRLIEHDDGAAFPVDEQVDRDPGSRIPVGLATLSTAGADSFAGHMPVICREPRAA